LNLPSIQEAIQSTRFVDTHEHLLEERTRLAGPGAHNLQPCDDAALLFNHYAANDLWSAGMPVEEYRQFFSPNVDPADKWRLVEPYWRRSRHTGYLQAVEESLWALFGIERLDSTAFGHVTEAMRGMVAPGFYRRILHDAAGVEVCQVNSLENPVPETQYPDLLQQDLSIVGFSTGLNPDVAARWGQISGRSFDSLVDWHEIIDWAFTTYGPRVDAVKSQAAYARRLNYEDVSAENAKPLYNRMLGGDALGEGERKALEDHLMRYCITKAGDHRLPVKLHCGYYAGNDRMPLDRVQRNAADICPLLVDFPNVSFVLMHIGYPYQDEYVALTKHYRNVTIDLCWAWIINPAATVRFVKEFLVAAPANKLLTFGGDYATVENIVGHAAIARRGLGQALSELVAEGWLDEADALDLVEPLMRGNARELFPIFERGVPTAIARP
jgi:predicted TIM-barrel fold metal-dependent hydrolase